MFVRYVALESMGAHGESIAVGIPFREREQQPVAAVSRLCPALQAPSALARKQLSNLLKPTLAERHPDWCC
jgi:hypothetical protein